MLILALPVVNIFMYFFWAFAGDVNTNKRNVCRAALLWMAIGIALAIVMVTVVGPGRW